MIENGNEVTSGHLSITANVTRLHITLENFTKHIFRNIPGHICITVDGPITLVHL